MIKLDRYTNVRSVEEVRAELEEFNKCVDILRDALTWLEEATKDKLDKKATVAILDKCETEYTSWHEKAKEIGNYKWVITIGDYRYGTDYKSINITIYRRAEYGWNEVRNFYTSEYRFERGSTWAEVWESINRYVKPHYKIIDGDTMRVWHDKLVGMLEELAELEGESNRNYENNHWDIETFLESN